MDAEGTTILSYGVAAAVAVVVLVIGLAASDVRAQRELAAATGASDPQRTTSFASGFDAPSFDLASTSVSDGGVRAGKNVP